MGLEGELLREESKTMAVPWAGLMEPETRLQNFIAGKCRVQAVGVEARLEWVERRVGGEEVDTKGGDHSSRTLQ